MATSATNAPLRVMMAGGGTGGHVFPALAVAAALRRRNAECQIVFVGTERGLEYRVVPRAGYPLRTLPVRGMKGLGLLGKLRGLFSLPKSLWMSRMYMNDFKPNVVFGTGGYASGPAVLQGVFARRPTVIFEPNAEPGLTNRMLGPLVTRVAVNFDETAKRFGSRAVRTGSPVRGEFAQVKAWKWKEPFSILVFGGSRGALELNRAVLSALESLKKSGLPLRIVHQTGEQDYDRVQTVYKEAQFGAEVFDFIDEMANAFDAAHLVICRSGASTVAELAAAGRPSILVPFPFATDNHQLRNAEAMVRAGAARLVEQSEASGERLAAEILGLLSRPEELEEMAAAARDIAVPDAADRIAELLESVAR